MPGGLSRRGECPALWQPKQTETAPPKFSIPRFTIADAPIRYRTSSHLERPERHPTNVYLSIYLSVCLAVYSSMGPTAIGVRKSHAKLYRDAQLERNRKFLRAGNSRAVGPKSVGTEGDFGHFPGVAAPRAYQWLHLTGNCDFLLMFSSNLMSRSNRGGDKVSKTRRARRSRASIEPHL